MPRKRIRVLNAHGDAETWIERLREAGYEVDTRAIRRPADLKALGRHVPSVVAIDLARAPSQGRDLGLAVRQQKATRYLPLVFVEGSPTQVTRVQSLLPDAVHTQGGRICDAVERAFARPPQDGVRPPSVLAGYSGTPLPKKLGMKPASIVRLVGAPRDFETTLGALPEAVRLRRRGDGARDITIWFIRRRRGLEQNIEPMAARVTTDKLWIAWPKKTSPLAADVSEREVRTAGLANGLVDFKICAIDEDWSGLCFTRRKI
jgi:hypothetical protein